MSMLYLWHPTLLNKGSAVQFILTRGDSDQIGKGSKRFISALVDAIGTSSAPERWSVQSYRCNYYSEYWEEGDWESRWDFVWRVRVQLESPVNRVKLKMDYVGIDEIDDPSPNAEAYKRPPFRCLTVARFSSEKSARAAESHILKAQELGEARRATGAKASKTDVLRIDARQFHLHAELGSGDQSFFDSKYVAAVLSELSSQGGVIHAGS